MSRAATSAVLLAILCAAQAPACVSMGPVVASHDEYRLWRGIRMTSSSEERARLLHRLIAGYPKGHFTKRAVSEEEALDHRFFETGQRDLPGLRVYVALFPSGRHIDVASQRLAALERAEKVRAEAVTAERHRREALDADLEVRRRAWCERTLHTWTHVFVNVTGWGKPVEQVLAENATLATAWRAEPTPACEGDLCLKEIPHHYFVAVRGSTRVDRDLRLRIRLVSQAGNLVGADIELPGNALLACQELAQQVQIDPEDPVTSVAAKNAGADMLRAIVHAEVGRGNGGVTPAGPAGIDQPLRIEQVVRPPLEVEVWRQDPEGTMVSPFDADGIRIRFVPPAGAGGSAARRPGPRAPP